MVRSSSLLISAAVATFAAAPIAHAWEKSCVECPAGESYHVFIEGPSSFGEALHATPEGCILAPITCHEDWVGINSALDDNPELYVYIGIYKPMEDYMAECPLDENHPCDVTTAGWINLDGSEVPDIYYLWDEHHPINSRTGGRNYGGFHGSGGLRSFHAVHEEDFMDGAVYQCCYPKKGLYCINWGGSEYLEEMYGAW